MEPPGQSNSLLVYTHTHTHLLTGLLLPPPLPLPTGKTPKAPDSWGLKTGGGYLLWHGLGHRDVFFPVPREEAAMTTSQGGTNRGGEGGCLLEPQAGWNICLSVW